MKIGILGATGPAGSGLAVRLASVGHHVVMGSRSKYRAMEVRDELIDRWDGHDLHLEAGDNAAAADSEVVVVATPWNAAAAKRIGPVEVDLARHRVVRDGEEEDLPTREAELLRYLLRNRDRTVSRTELLEKVWEYPNAAGVETRTVDNYVVRLRQKIEPDPRNPRVVLTVRGKGYRFGWEEG